MCHGCRSVVNRVRSSTQEAGRGVDSQGVRMIHGGPFLRGSGFFSYLLMSRLNPRVSAYQTNAYTIGKNVCMVG